MLYNSLFVWKQLNVSKRFTTQSTLKNHKILHLPHRFKHAKTPIISEFLMGKKVFNDEFGIT